MDSVADGLNGNFKIYSILLFFLYKYRFTRTTFYASKYGNTAFTLCKLFCVHFLLEPIVFILLIYVTYRMQFPIQEMMILGDFFGSK